MIDNRYGPTRDPELVLSLLLAIGQIPVRFGEAPHLDESFGVLWGHAQEPAVTGRLPHVELGLAPAASRARCIRTLSERSRSRVPVRSMAGGNPVRSPNSGEM